MPQDERDARCAYQAKIDDWYLFTYVERFVLSPKAKNVHGRYTCTWVHLLMYSCTRSWSVHSSTLYAKSKMKIQSLTNDYYMFLPLISILRNLIFIFELAYSVLVLMYKCTCPVHFLPLVEPTKVYWKKDIHKIEKKQL